MSRDWIRGLNRRLEHFLTGQRSDLGVEHVAAFRRSIGLLGLLGLIGFSAVLAYRLVTIADIKDDPGRLRLTGASMAGMSAPTGSECAVCTKIQEQTGPTQNRSSGSRAIRPASDPRSVALAVTQQFAILAAIGVIVCALLTSSAFFWWSSDRVLFRDALVTQVICCGLVSWTTPRQLYEPGGAGMELPILSWVAPIIVTFGLTVPARPREVRFAALACVLCVALGLIGFGQFAGWAASLRGGDVVAAQLSGDWLGMSWTAYESCATHVPFRFKLPMLLSAFLGFLIVYYAAPLIHNSGLRGKVLGNHRTELTPIGSGSVGTVYKAYHIFLGGEPVAAKTARWWHLKPAKAKGMLQKFFHEAEKTQLLRSPQTVKTINFGAAQYELYIINEFIKGRTLSSAMRKLGRPYTELETARILDQICTSLAEAHSVHHREVAAGKRIESPLLHLDLKPENVMFTADPPNDLELLVVDYGNGALLAGMDGRSDERRPKPTLHYRAPEQIRGEPATTASDVYAVGCLGFMLLTRTNVFDPRGDLSAKDVDRAHVEKTPPAPSSMPGCTAARLDGILLKCLSKDPKDRFDGDVNLVQQAIRTAVPERFPTQTS